MTLDELTKPMTRDEVATAIYSALAAKGVDTTSWKSGGVARAIVTGAAIVLSAASQLQAYLAKMGFLELAEGDWLTLVAKYVYGVERNLGSFATATVTLDNGDGGVYSGGAGDLVCSASATGKTYRNTAAFSIAALETDVEIPVQADELGSGSSAAADGIDTLETSLLGVTISGSTTAVGTDEERDSDLRTRCYEKTATLSPNGPRDAYAYIARSAERADGTSIGVTRVATIADGAGNVDVYCATASGAVPGTVGDTSTDLGLIDEAIQTQVVPNAVTATVQSATALAIDVTYELWVRDTIGRTHAQMQADIEERLGEYFAEVPIGGELITGEATGRVYLSAIEGVIAAEVGDDMVKLAVTLPAGDTDVASSEAPVAGTVNLVAIHDVSGGAL